MDDILRSTTILYIAGDPSNDTRWLTSSKKTQYFTLRKENKQVYFSSRKYERYYIRSLESKCKNRRCRKSKKDTIEREKKIG